MGRLWRVHHPEPGAATGAVIALQPSDAHHAVRVLRLQPGEQLGVFDGRGREWRATLIACGPGGALARLEEEIREPVEPILEVTLYQGLSRAECMELVIQKATELGAAAVLGLSSERAEGAQVPARKLLRWQRIAVESCKQCGRRTVPRIELAADLPPAQPDVLALLLDPGGDPLSSVEPELRPRRVWLAVGPESGFAEHELLRWRGEGWRRVALGPRILRAETAGVVAAAIAMQRWGDLGG